MGTKVCLISDIHGNSIALKKVLEDINKMEDVEHIYCLGDMLGIGHQTNEVLELLHTQTNISCVIGNHDRDIINVLKGYENTNDPLLEHHKWIAKQIERQYRDYLLNLPKKIYCNHKGVKMLLTHYYLDSDENFASPDLEPTVKKLDSHFSSELVNIVAFGHHHKVHFFQSAHKTYVNPGPAGIDNIGPVAKYCIIDIDHNISVTFKQVNYNLGELKNFIDNFYLLDVPFGDRIVKTGYNY